MFLIYLNIIIQYFFTVKVKGKVSDQNNYEISGAKVYNNIDTTYTGFDGSFDLETDSKTKYIYIEMISYYDETYTWDNDSIIEIKLNSK